MIDICRRLELVNWGISFDSVQSCWNAVESELVKVVDEIAPLVEFLINSVKSVVTPPVIKNKMPLKYSLSNFATLITSGSGVWLTQDRFYKILVLHRFIC